MKRLPVDVSNFKFMIENDYVYVDKTEIMYSLLRDRRLFFLSRPRRFGKSLLISMLYELFSGNKQLFKDTWIGKCDDYNWQEYPIISLDFSRLNNKSGEKFTADLIWSLEQIAHKHSISLSNAPSIQTKFTYLIEQLALKNKVVILIDEYDYPLLYALTNPTLAKDLHAAARDFFAVIKSLDQYIHCVFITGVTRISKTSIFSGMNNLNDLTMDEKAADLLGYTKKDLENYFHIYIEQFAQKQNISLQKTYDDIKKYYNGYRFSKKELLIYNPYSALRCLINEEFANYWFETGTPSFLIEILKKQGNKLEDIKNIELSASSFGTFDLDTIHIFPLLFQTGYLTIQEYHKQDDRYILGYPNAEVRESFTKYLMAAFSGTSPQDVDHALNQFKRALKQNNIELFCTTLKSLFANIPYQLHISSEAYYHSLLQFLITLLGLEGHSEICSDKGRIDMVLETNTTIIIFEFKFESTGKKALKQIVEKKYYEKYLHRKKPIILVGLSFDIKNKELLLDFVKKDIQ